MASLHNSHKVYDNMSCPVIPKCFPELKPKVVISLLMVCHPFRACQTRQGSTVHWHTFQRLGEIGYERDFFDSLCSQHQKVVSSHFMDHEIAVAKRQVMLELLLCAHIISLGPC